MKKWLRIPLIIILAVLTILIFNEPGPVWFFPIFLIAYLFKDKLSRLENLKPRLIIKYVIFGVLIGLIIEMFAIIASQSIPIGQRALFHQEPIPDLILAIGYYAMLMLGSYIMLRRYNYSLKQIFILGGIFGVILEQHGGVLLSIFEGNILGGIYVFLSYSSLIALPYLVFQKGFNKFKRKETIWKYLISLLILIGFYLLFLGYFLIVNPIVSS
jgi:hypothetical protein